MRFRGFMVLSYVLHFVFMGCRGTSMVTSIVRSGAFMAFHIKLSWRRTRYIWFRWTFTPFSAFMQVNPVSLRFYGAFPEVCVLPWGSHGAFMAVPA